MIDFMEAHKRITDFDQIWSIGILPKLIDCQFKMTDLFNSSKMLTSECWKRKKELLHTKMTWNIIRVARFFSVQNTKTG
jgi:hypothetical protein